jgi:hypothetical protein
MKRSVSHLIFLLAFSFLLAGGRATFGSSEIAGRVESRQREDKRSLEETQRFIRETLIEHAGMTTAYPEARLNTTVRVESVNFDGCYIIINYVARGRTPGRSSYSGRVSDIDPLNVKLLRMKTQPKPTFYVMLNAVGMEYKFRYKSRGVSLVQDRQINYMGVFFADEELANQVAEAFRHLIKLCLENKK